MNKIFGIGFHKTGTSSLGDALEVLGYKVCGSRTDLAGDLMKGNLEPAFNIVELFDAFQDNPWPILYRELDKKFPNSKFILTIRDSDKWLESSVNYFGYSNTKMREWIYGVGHPKGNEQIFLNRYNKHNKEVLDYFKDRPNDLLIFSLENGDGWEKICSFLDKKIPSVPFPWANKRENVLKRFIKNRFKKT